MKATALAAAFVLATSAAFAGNVEPVVEDAPPLVVEPEPEPAGSSPLIWIIPVVAAVAIAIAASD